MSSSCFRQALITDMACMPFTDDQKTYRISSLMPPSPSSIPLMSVNSVWSHSSEYQFKDTTFSRRPMEPHEQICRIQEELLTDIKYTLPGYEFTPKNIEGTTQLKWQALALDSSFGGSGEKSPSGNVWDMLVDLLGTEKKKNFTTTTERLTSSPSYEGKFLINSMTSCNQEEYGRQSFEATGMSAKGGYQMSVPIEDFHASKYHRSMSVNGANKSNLKKKCSLTGNELQLVPLYKEIMNIGTRCIPDCLVPVPPKKELGTLQRNGTESNNKGETMCRVFNNAVSVTMHETDQSSAKSSVLSSEIHMKNPQTSLLPTKSMQQEYERSNSGVTKSKRMGLDIIKQRGKLTKKRNEKTTLKERSKSTLPDYSQVLVLPKAIIKDKPQGTPLAYPGVSYVQSIENEHFIQDSMVQISKTLDSASLRKTTSLSTHNYKESQDVIMWTDTTMKFLNPPSDYGKMHSVLMSSQENESGFSNTRVIELNGHPRIIVEKEPSFDSNKNTSGMRHMKNTNKNQCFTGLFKSVQVPELLSEISKFGSTKMSDEAEIWENMNEETSAASLTYESKPSDNKKLKVPKLPDMISKLTQPKKAETWEGKDEAKLTRFLTNGSEFSDGKSLQVPELSNILAKLSQPKTEFRKEENAKHLTESFAIASESSEDKNSKETGTAPACEMRKFPGLQVDLVSFVRSDRSLKSHEGWNVNSSALVCPYGIHQNSNGSVTALEENSLPEQQLKLLLHASHCQLLRCPVTSCEETKQLLKHCFWCRKEALCPVHCCSVTRNLLKHWDVCKVFHCPLCSSLRQCHGHSEFSIKGIPRARSYSSNSSKRIGYAPYKANNTSRNVANPFTSNKLTNIDVTNGSLPTITSKSFEAATSPTTVTAPQSQFLLDDKYKSSKSTQCDLQGNSRCLTQCVHGPCSNLSQTGWNFPLGSNDLGENLDHIVWSDSPREDIQQEMTMEFTSKSTGEGPKLAAGFTMFAKHLRNRLDCLLHGVACEEPDYKAKQECTLKYCSIMKSSVIHMSSCSEFHLCSNVMCLLFSPLFMHWKKCCGPCAVCGPINMKYNKKKLLKKLLSAFVKSEIISEGAVIDRYRETNHVCIQGSSRVAAPYHLRKYMIEEQMSIPTVYSGCALQLAESMKAQEAAVSCAGNTWDQLTGIDMNQQRFFGNTANPDVTSIGFLESHMEQSYCSLSEYRSNDTGNRSMHDLIDAISLYNFHFSDYKYME